jgi:hypothetical protein
MLRLGKKHHMLEGKKTSQPHKNTPVPPSASLNVHLAFLYSKYRPRNSEPFRHFWDYRALFVELQEKTG